MDSEPSALDLAREAEAIDLYYSRTPYACVVLQVSGGYSARIREFPGCAGHGVTAEDALLAVDRAAIAWICTALAQGRPIPPAEPEGEC